MNDVVARQHRILVVEDELSVAEPLVDGLTGEGFFVSLVGEGMAASRSVDSQYWDLIILDLMLPDLSGEAVLNYLTQRPDYPPVLVLTARGGLHDKLTLFRHGCDDYLTKPYLFEEILARIHALLRRPVRVQGQILSYLDMELDTSTNELRAGVKKVSLTPKEAAILRLLFSDPERMFSRKDILHSVWCVVEEPAADYVGVYLYHLRRKLTLLGRENWLRTVRATGFVLSNPVLKLHVDVVD